MTKKLILNADDFGLCPGVNHGILEAIKEGVVTSTTLMINMPYAEEAIKLAQKNDLNCVGLHLSLTAGEPVSNPDDIPSLVSEEGVFSRDLFNSEEEINLDEVEMELNNQIKKFINNYKSPTHLDSHHHVHLQPQIVEVIIKLAKKYDLAVRVGRKNSSLEVGTELKTTDFFSMDFYGEDKINSDYLKQIINSFPEGTIEIMCHPAKLTSQLCNYTSYNQEREIEYKTLTQSKLKLWLEKNNIKLTNFSKL